MPSQFFYEFLEDKFVDLLRKTLYKVIGDGTKLMYNVLVDKSSGTTVNQESTTRSTAIPQSGLPRVDERKAPGLLRAPAVQDLDPHLNPNYNFETFIEGYSNKLSRSVAEAVAENPAKTVFNPLFLHGASGVGKTHLANAIGTRIKELYPDKRVLYVSAHLFQVQYTDSVRNNTTNDFINFYQTIDVLIIDDMISSGGSMLDTARQLKEMNARRVFICTTFGLFTDGLDKFDEYYEKGWLDRVITTNLNYRIPELLERPYYVEANMSKYLASIIDIINHDVSVEKVRSSNEKIMSLMEKVNSR